MIERIEIIIDSGIIIPKEILIIPPKKEINYNGQEKEYRQNIVDDILKFVFCWKKEYGVANGYDLEEYRISIVMNSKEIIYHGKGIFPPDYYEFKEMINKYFNEKKYL